MRPHKAKSIAPSKQNRAKLNESGPAALATQVIRVGYLSEVAPDCHTRGEQTWATQQSRIQG